MPQQFNYHTHTKFSDGRNTMEEYTKYAIRNNFSSLGFSDHAPLYFPTHWTMNYDNVNAYFAEFERIKELYIDKLEMYIGFELDYMRGADLKKYFNNFKTDYIIGSVHYLGQLQNGEWYTVDLKEDLLQTALEQCFDNDPKKMISHYYQLVSEMITELKPNVVAHLDLIKKFNKNQQFFNHTEKWYNELVYNVLTLMKENDAILELNVSGFRRCWNKEPYPSLDILKLSKKINLPVTISADAHDLSYLDDIFIQGLNLLQEAGYKEVSVLKNGNWCSEKL